MNFITDLKGHAIEANKKLLNKANNRIKKLALAIADGADVNLLLDTQEQIKAEKQVLERRNIELQETLDSMPNPDVVQAQADMIRRRILLNCFTTDWRKMPISDIRKFLHYLFSENPRKNGYGVLLAQKDNEWIINFEGRLNFEHTIIDGFEEFKPELTDTQIAEIADRMQIKESFIKTLRKLERFQDKHDRLKYLLDEATRLDTTVKKAKKTAKNAEKKLNKAKLFNGAVNNQRRH